MKSGRVRFKISLHSCVGGEDLDWGSMGISPYRRDETLCVVGRYSVEPHLAPGSGTVEASREERHRDSDEWRVMSDEREGSFQNLIMFGRRK